MGWLLSDDERAALWPSDELPCGEAARLWQSPEARLKRYEDALNGILACYPASPAICMLQAVAATALGKDDLARELLYRAEQAERAE
jgi:hypothetical protein